MQANTDNTEPWIEQCKFYFNLHPYQLILLRFIILPAHLRVPKHNM
jgi:hypothetical protein